MEHMRQAVVAAAALGMALAASAAQAVVTQIASPITFTRDTSVNKLLVGELSGWINSTSDYQVGATFAMRLVSNTYNAQTNIDSWQFRLYLDPFAYDNPSTSGTISYRMSAFGFDVNNSAADPDILASGGVVVNSAGTRRFDATGAVNSGAVGLAGARQGG